MRNKQRNVREGAERERERPAERQIQREMQKEAAGPLSPSICSFIQLISGDTWPTGCHFMAQDQLSPYLFPQVCAPKSWSAEWDGAATPGGQCSPTSLCYRCPEQLRETSPGMAEVSMGIWVKENLSHTMLPFPQPLRLGSGLNTGQVSRWWLKSLWPGCVH